MRMPTVPIGRRPLVNFDLCGLLVAYLSSEGLLLLLPLCARPRPGVGEWGTAGSVVVCYLVSFLILFVLPPPAFPREGRDKAGRRYGPCTSWAQAAGEKQT